MKMINRTLLAISLLLVTLSVSADNFYKWTDESGVVHYSQRAPKGQESQTITTKTSPSAPTAPQQAENAPKTAEEPTENKEPETTKTPSVVKKDAATCQRAKKSLQTLKSRPIVRQNGKVMTIKEKNKEIENLNQIIAVHC